MNVALAIQRFREIRNIHRKECRNGHERIPENLYRRKNGLWDCLICKQSREKARLERHQAKVLKKLYARAQREFPVACIDCRSRRKFQNQAELDAHLRICEAYRRATNRAG